MKNVGNLLYIILIITAASIHAARKVPRLVGHLFNLLLGDEDGKVSRIESWYPEYGTSVHQFKTQAITAMARYKTSDRFFVVKKKSSFLGLFRSDSYVYSCTLDFENSVTKCDDEPYYEVGRINVDITSIATTGDGLFIGDTGGNLNYCDLNTIQGCKTIRHFEDKTRITGIAYDSVNDSIYVSLHFRGPLYRCPGNPKEANSCDRVYTYNPNLETHGLTAVHVAYESVWLGTENGRLLRCENKGTRAVGCFEFYKIEWTALFEPAIYSIGTRGVDGYVYVGLRYVGLFKSVNAMWRCHPIFNNSCEFDFELPQETRSFLILD